MTNKLQLLLYFILIMFLSACGTSSLRQYDSQNPCFTTIEGEIQSNIPRWNGIKPFLVINKIGNETESLSGKVLEVRDEGVLFDEDRNSAFYNPEPTFYAKDDIHTFIDENGTLVFGENLRANHTVKQIKFIFTPQNTTDDGPYSFKAKRDEPFSYCIPPGKYKFDRFLVQRGKGYQDISKKNMGLEFDITSSASNYLGTFYLDYRDSLKNVQPINIPLKMDTRPKGATYTAMFGLIGATTFMISNKGVIDTLNMKIVHGADYMPHSTNHVRHVTIK